MAYIDKIHLRKEDIPTFYEYLKSIDGDYRKFFPNSKSILNYTYYYQKLEDDILPVSNFPQIIDRWLAHRKDLPEIIKNQLEFQYNGKNIFEEPIYNEIDEKELSHKFKIRSWKRCEGRRFNKAMTYWSIYVFGHWRYYPSLNKFVDNDKITPDLVGHRFWWGSSDEPIKSIKAVFRFLRKHGFPKGTKLRISDSKYNISSLIVEYV